MRRITNITDEPIQLHTIPLDASDADLLLTLRFYSTIQAWYMDIEWKGESVNGIKLSAGVLHTVSSNLPFGFLVVDTSGNGLDPFKIDDFLSGRNELALLTASEMESIRGVPVET